jgi:dipeptidyl aminopeptidase/acylaminoacyl peptidase
MSLLALALAAVLALPRAVAFDPVTEDAPVTDVRFAPSSYSFKLVSHGDPINAMLLTAGGAGPHATVLLLHGFPGNERNLDLAQALRRAGYHVLVMNYRGVWGSAGQFSFAHAVEDAAAALEFLASPAAAEKYGIDVMRLAVVGHSVGGFVALQAAARAPGVKAVAALAPFNSSPAMLAKFLERRGPAQDTNVAGGPVVVASLPAMITPPADEAFAATLARLRDRPVLLLAGTRDTVLPMADHHEPILAALAPGRERPVDVKVFADDHSFSASRIAVMREVVGWLSREVRP